MSVWVEIHCDSIKFTMIMSEPFHHYVNGKMVEYSEYASRIIEYYANQVEKQRSVVEKEQEKLDNLNESKIKWMTNYYKDRGKHYDFRNSSG